MRKGNVIGKLAHVILFAFFCVLAINPMIAAEMDSIKTVVYIKSCKHISEQLNKGAATYVIKCNVDLKGECIKIPDGSTLYVKKGIVKNGRIEGDYVIQAESRLLFDNVDVSTYKYPFKFTWLIGNRRGLYSNDFEKLPNVNIDFEGVEYVAKEAIVLDELPGFSFANLNLQSDYSIRYWTSAVAKGECMPSGNGKGYISRIHTSNAISNDYIGYVIEVTTADETKYDSRPDAKGVPTLYKGLTSVITSISDNEICFSDSLEWFSRERIYNRHKVKASYVIYKPRKFVLDNCRFIFTSNSGASFNGCGFLIDNCIFEARNGSNALLSLGGHTGKVSNCIIRGAYYVGTGTSYGIQVNKGTRILIENSEFYENRRGVDFSGAFESRYNEVRNCSFYQDKNEGKTGSAVGGHSTSFGNVFRGNIINGDFQIGIHCRGENEVIEGNTFECFATWMIGYGYNTMIVNNKVVQVSDFATGVFAGSDINVKGNRLVLKGNKVDVRAVLIVGNNSVGYLLEDNIIRFRPNTTSIKPVVFSERPISYELKDNEIEVSRNDVRVRLLEGVDIPKKKHVKVGM